MRIQMLVAALTLFASVAAAQTGKVEDKAKKDIMVVLKEDGHFTMFLKAIQVSGVEKELKGAKNITILAPDDDAFAALPAAVSEALFKDKKLLREIVMGHVLLETTSMSALGSKAGDKTTAGDSKLNFSIQDNLKGTSKAGDKTLVIALRQEVRLMSTFEKKADLPSSVKAKVKKADISISNGFVQTIDTVLLRGE
jgi:uncharacterized surface protein with fasciclin (FAS1) repeats